MCPRHPVQQCQAPILPALRPRTPRDSPRSSEGSNHDWQKENLRMAPFFHPRNFALNTPSGQDVQFFREASDVQFDETGNRKRKYRYGDEDEIEMEQQERKRRQMLNKEFRAFSEKLAEAAVSSVRLSSLHILWFLLTIS
jgi:hypothetical protein